jgi:hypothetical protein
LQLANQAKSCRCIKQQSNLPLTTDNLLAPHAINRQLAPLQSAPHNWQLAPRNRQSAPCNQQSAPCNQLHAIGNHKQSAIGSTGSTHNQHVMAPHAISNGPHMQSAIGSTRNGSTRNTQWLHMQHARMAPHHATRNGSTRNQHTQSAPHAHSTGLEATLTLIQSIIHS